MTRALLVDLEDGPRQQLGDLPIATEVLTGRELAQHLDDHSVRAFLLQSLDLKSDPPRWRMNLAALRERMADLTGWPGHEGLSWDGPALFLAGGESDYVSPEHEAEIRAAFPKAQLERVAGTSHWLHAEKPAEVVEAVVGFLG